MRSETRKTLHSQSINNVTITIILLALAFAASHYRKQVRGFYLRRKGRYYAEVCEVVQSDSYWARMSRIKESAEDAGKREANKPSKIAVIWPELSEVTGISDRVTLKEWFGSKYTTVEEERDDARNAIELELSRRGWVEIGTTKTWRYND